MNASRRSRPGSRRRWLLVLIGVLAGSALAGVRSPRGPGAATLAREQAATPEGMAYVPGGWCLVGSDDPEETSEARVHRVFVPSFYIDRLEVTNAQFHEFRPAHTFPPDEAKLPVTNVTYEEAEDYARWAGARLPTNDEWEKAARGTDGRRYPWGRQWEAERVAPRARRKPRPVREAEALCPPSRVQPVGSVAAGASPYGCLDMAGNAWEWVSGFHQGNRDQRIIRGGAVGYGERACRTYHRGVEGSGVT